MSQDSTSHIVQSLVVNLVIALSKGVAAVISGSGAMLAETLHSFADCGNQGLLLLGVRRTRRAPDAQHPMGYGRELYFWSFMVALLLFSGGGVFSIYEGVHKTLHPEKVESITMGVIVLLIAFALEGWATIGNIRELNRRRGKTAFFRYLQRTKDSDLVVIFGENSAAVLGLVFAIAALVLSSVTGDGRWDGIGSLAIGVVLIAVAVFLSIEVKSLLVGEAADPELEQTIRELAVADPNVDELLRLLTTQQGPGEVVVAMKVRMRNGLGTTELCEAINAFERTLKLKAPEIKWSFIEPDVRD